MKKLIFICACLWATVGNAQSVDNRVLLADVNEVEFQLFDLSSYLIEINFAISNESKDTIFIFEDSPLKDGLEKLWKDSPMDGVLTPSFVYVDRREMLTLMEVNNKL
jgi:hypothetical protein